MFNRFSGFAAALGCLCALGATAHAGTNDTCGTAAHLGLDSGFTTTIFSSLAGAAADNSVSCRAVATPDLFYRFVAPCHGTLRVDTCGTHDTGGQDQGLDTVLSLHNVGCPLGAAFRCNDDWTDGGSSGGTCAGDAGLARDSVVSTALLQGQEVLIRVGSFDTAPTDFAFTLNLRYTPAAGPLNDNCAGAEPKALGDSFVVDISCASTEIADAEECPANADVWYEFQSPATGIAQVDTCGTYSAYGIDSVLAVHYNTCNSSDYHTACNDDAGYLCTGPNGDYLDSAIHFPVLQGGTYLVRVGDLNGASFGPKIVRVNSRVIPVGTGCGLPGDENADGVVNFNDLNRVLGNFGNECP